MSLPQYPKYPLQVTLSVDSLYTYYYFELPRHYKTVQNELEFWTLSYILNGEMQVFFEGEERQLKQGDIIFYKPYTRYWGQTSAHPPNLMIITFDCSSPELQRLASEPFPLTPAEKTIISTLLNEAYGSFELLTQDCMILSRQGAPFGSEQLIKNYLEILLLQLIRRKADEQKHEVSSVSAPNDNRTAGLLSGIVTYMREHLADPLTMENICKRFGVGKAQLSASFKTKTGYGVMEYFKVLKVEEAKRLIREDSITMTELSDRLGYTNVQYFSKQFKRITGMKPTEYAKTVAISFGRGHSRTTAVYADPFGASVK